MATNMNTKTPRELLAQCAEQLSTDGHYELAHEIAALKAAQPAPAAPYQVPGGWQLVPVEPNHQMLEYFDRVRFRPLGVSSESAAKSMYAEMLAAAPKAAA